MAPVVVITSITNNVFTQLSLVYLLRVSSVDTAAVMDGAHPRAHRHAQLLSYIAT